MADVQVLIVGSGAAGLAAAITARNAGASRVLIAEGEGVVGGSSRLSGGLIMGAGTKYQRAKGINDDADSLFHDYMQVNRWNVDAGVVRRFVDMAGPTVEWLGNLGVEYYDELVFGGDERVPRVHVPIGRGQAIVDTLHRACRDLDVDIALGRRVDRLLLDDRGAVVGIAVGPDEITADAVILTTGGFGANPTKLEEFFPSATATGRSWYIGAPGSRGDALDLTKQVGAQTIGRDRGLRLLDTGFAAIYEAYLPGWLMLVNREGRRFADETAPYGMMDFLIREQGDHAYAICDRSTLEAATSHGIARYKQVIPGSTKRQSPHWTTDIVDQMVRDGKAFCSDDIEGLAEQLGVDARTLRGSVHRYNAMVAAKDDADFMKDAKFLEPIEHGPFYAAELRPSTICFTAYGLRTDRNAQVLNDAGSPITGLYAAGECTGGVVGAHYVGSGNSYANITVFGRIAGESAATAHERSAPTQ